jgi:hypothetical protein
MGKYMKKKVAPFVGVLGRIRKLINKKSALLLYNAYIQSHFNYMLSVWGSVSSTKLNNLQVLQNRSLKYVYNKGRLFPSIDLYTRVVEKNIIMIKFLVDYEAILLIYKIKNNLMHSHYEFLSIESLTGRITRQREHISIPSYRTSLGQKSLLYRGSILFNGLSDELKQEDLNVFKYKLKLSFRNSMSLH